MTKKITLTLLFLSVYLISNAQFIDRYGITMTCRSLNLNLIHRFRRILIRVF